MTTTSGYRDWRSLELAIKDAAKKVTRASGPGIPSTTVDSQIKQARFDRFLTRVFADGEQSEWLLKGGVSMLARVPKARSTKDLDLAAGDTSDLDSAEKALSNAVGVELDDHLSFHLVRSTPTGLGDQQPGVQTKRYFYACIDTGRGVQVDEIQVDIVVGPSPIGTPEVIEPANRLPLGRTLITHPYRLYPVSDQIADKVCATTTDYSDGRSSSRVKDLIDLVILARTQKVDLNELQHAIAAKRGLSQIEPFARLQIPENWEASYPNTARGVPGASDLSPAEAEAYAAQLVDPALSMEEGSDPAVWVPGAGWTSPDDVERVEADVAADIAAGEDVYVRHHTRAGWPVRQHWRSARGSTGSANRS